MAQTFRERQQDSYVRSKLSRGGIVLWSGIVSALLFAPSDWRGCGYFRHGPSEFLHFGYVFAWLLIFFALRMRWRVVLLAVTAPLVLYSFGLNGIPEENAGPEAAAVGALRQIQSSLQADRSKHQEEYPESLPSTSVSPYAQKFYRYKYVPSRDASGRIEGYLVQATPSRRDCDFYVSFTIADDGRVFYTFEQRAAITKDKILE